MGETINVRWLCGGHHGERVRRRVKVVGNVMNKGYVVICFVSGATERFDISTDGELINHPTWMSIENWWMSSEEDSIVYLTIGDSMLLLDRAKVTHVKLKPYEVLEIKSAPSFPPPERTS